MRETKLIGLALFVMNILLTTGCDMQGSSKQNAELQQARKALAEATVELERYKKQPVVESKLLNENSEAMLREQVKRLSNDLVVEKEVSAKAEQELANVKKRLTQTESRLASRERQLTELSASLTGSQRELQAQASHSLNEVDRALRAEAEAKLQLRLEQAEKAATTRKKGAIETDLNTDHIPYTGLIVVAPGLKPGMTFRLLVHKTGTQPPELYSVTAINQSIKYYPDLEVALRQTDVIGGNPLVVTAIASDNRRVFLSEKDGNRVVVTNKQSQFLEDRKVIIVFTPANEEDTGTR